MPTTTETTLVSELYERFGRPQAEQAGETPVRRRGNGTFVAGGQDKGPGYLYERTVSVDRAPDFVAADGYVRRTPIQVMRTPPGYRARIVRRVVGYTLLALLAAAAVYALVFTNVMGR